MAQGWNAIVLAQLLELAVSRARRAPERANLCAAIWSAKRGQTHRRADSCVLGRDFQCLPPVAFPSWVPVWHGCSLCHFCLVRLPLGA